MRTRMRLVIILLLAAWTAGAIQAQITSNPIPGADCETRACGRDQGSRAPSGHARDSSRRSGRVACRLGARQLCARSSRRPPLRQRFARLSLPDRRRTTSRRSMRTSPRCFRMRSTTGWRADSSGSSFIRSSRETACSTPCTRERAAGNPKTPDFIPPGFALKDVTYHNIITEWHATNPAAERFRRNPTRTAS